MHCHTDPLTTGGVPMFSWGDIMSLMQIARQHNSNGLPKDYAEYTVILSVGSAHYALKFKNYNDFITKVNANFKAFEKELEKLYGTSTATAPSNTLIKDFLIALKKHNFGGVGLYKATEVTDVNGVSSITGWNEQTLNANESVIEVPC